MSDLAFQYIGFGCVFLAALRIADVFVHVLLGYAVNSLGLYKYYTTAVDLINYMPTKDTVTYTATEKYDSEN